MPPTAAAPKPEIPKDMTDLDIARVPFLCDKCNEMADPLTEYTTCVTCSICGVRLYHTYCVEDHLRRLVGNKERMLGYGCPRGHGKCPQFQEHPCKGKATGTNHRMPGKKKPPVAPVVAQHKLPPKPKPPAEKRPAPKPGGPSLPAGGVALTKDQIAKQIAAKTSALAKVAGSDVAARLGGGAPAAGQVVGGAAVPGMEFESSRAVRGKPNNKKKKKKGGAGGGQTPDITNPKDAERQPSAGLTDLPALDPQLLAKLHGDQKVVSSLDAYNKLVGSHDASDEFTDDDEDEGQEEQEAVMAQQQQRPGAWASEESPELSPSPSSGALASPGSTAPAQDHLDSPNSDHAAQHALVPANMIDPADISAMIAAGADIHTLRFDFTAVRSAELPDELLNYCARLPPVVADMFITQLAEHVNKLGLPGTEPAPAPGQHEDPLPASPSSPASFIDPAAWAAAASPAPPAQHQWPPPGNHLEPPAWSAAPAPARDARPMPLPSLVAPPAMAAARPMQALPALPQIPYSGSWPHAIAAHTSWTDAPAAPAPVPGVTYRPAAAAAGGAAGGGQAAGVGELDDLLALCLGE